MRDIKHLNKEERLVYIKPKPVKKKKKQQTISSTNQLLNLNRYMNFEVGQIVQENSSGEKIIILSCNSNKKGEMIYKVCAIYNKSAKYKWLYQEQLTK